MAGNITSVPTISAFSKELVDYGTVTILIVMDRGIYSANNMKYHSIIGALPVSQSICEGLIHGSVDVENSRNYLQYGNEKVFHKEEIQIIARSYRDGGISADGIQETHGQTVFS